MTRGKAVKIVLVVLLAYASVVVLFESLLGAFQPEGGNTQQITTYEASGEQHTRVVARLESGDALYVAVNHWPRAWYGQLLDDPRVRVNYNGQQIDYRAVPLASDSEEYARVDDEHSLGLFFRFLTGFPPRRLIRLEPAASN